MATGQFQGRVIGQKEVGPQRQFVGLELQGSQKLMSVLEKLGTQGPQSMAGALFREANYLMTDAKRQTPVDQGPLRASGHVEEPVIDGSTVSVTVGFGGPAGIGNHENETNDKDVGYAVYVHEDLTARHDDGNAKYLENPALERSRTMEGRLAKDMKHDLER